LIHPTGCISLYSAGNPELRTPPRLEVGAGVVATAFLKNASLKKVYQYQMSAIGTAIS
jgi:hypothetical protein